MRPSNGSAVQDVGLRGVIDVISPVIQEHVVQELPDDHSS